MSYTIINSRTITRNILLRGLTEEEFNNLVFDYFPAVYNQFTNGQNKRQRVRILIEYAEKHRELEKLLGRLKSHFSDNLTLSDFVK